MIYYKDKVDTDSSENSSGITEQRKGPETSIGKEDNNTLLSFINKTKNI